MQFLEVIFAVFTIYSQLDLVKCKETVTYEDYNIDCSFFGDKNECINSFKAEEKITEHNQCKLLTNVSVVAIELDETIRLNISWSDIRQRDNVTVKLDSKDGTRCYSDNFVRDPKYLKENYIIRPNLQHTTFEVNPKCQYSIIIETDKDLCKVNYTIPECVGNICDCDLYQPEAAIVSVEQESPNNFLVKWDPGPTMILDREQQIVDVFFNYARKDTYESFSIVNWTERNFKENRAMISINKIPKGEEYILSALFKNNFLCQHQTTFEFFVPENGNHHLIILFMVVIVVLILALKREIIIKYLNKLISILPLRYNRIVTQPANVPLTQITYDKIGMQTNLQYTPVEFFSGQCDDYEFPRNRLIIKEKIGSGAFGNVYAAKALDICEVNSYKMVAVKTLGEQVTPEAINDFIGEIEIFKKIGEHPNIVRLLGCCTLETPYMMIMEFVPCGDLKKYLWELREQWLQNKDKQFFFSDSSNGAYIEPPGSPRTPVSITSSRLPSTTETVNTSLEDLVTPIIPQYSLEKVLDHNELQNFALQIAKGMAHLEKIPITHRDLAARNILINEFKVLKISDFGLSRKGPYINHKSKKLPLRWMAVEAIVDQKYDCKSDVWSFGVVLWEIATLGAFPYESVLDSFLIQFLQLGNRLERPEICTDELYLLMLQCWASNPDDRPTFEELVDTLDVAKRKVYVDFSHLNPTYVFPPSEYNSEKTMMSVNVN